VSRAGAVTTITTRPHGYVKGSFGIGVVGPAVLLIALVIPWRFHRIGEPLTTGTLIWCGILTCVGFALSIVAAEMGYTRHTLRCSPDELLIERRTRFRKKTQRLPRADITGLERGEAWFTSQNKPVHCLQINRKSGPPVKTLTARADAEITWAIQTLGPILDGRPA